MPATQGHRGPARSPRHPSGWVCPKLQGQVRLGTAGPGAGPCSRSAGLQCGRGRATGRRPPGQPVPSCCRRLAFQRQARQRRLCQGPLGTACAGHTGPILPGASWRGQQGEARASEPTHPSCARGIPRILLPRQCPEGTGHVDFDSAQDLGGVSLGLDSWGSSPGPQPGGSQSSLCGPEGGHWAGREAGVCQRPARRESPLCVGGGGPGLPEDGGPGCAIPPAVWRGGTQSPVPHPRPAGGLPSQSHPKSLPLPGSRGPCRKVRPELEKWRTQAISLLGPCPSAWGRFPGGGRSWVSRKP